MLNASLAPSGDVRRRCTWRGALPTPALPAPSPGAHFRRVATLGSDRRGRQTPKEGYQACATATVIHKGGGCNRQLGCKRCHASSASSGNISPGERSPAACRGRAGGRGRAPRPAALAIQ
eukprot:COSAG01_NODE_5269_length_4369_cov_15.316159_3_plen_120_part_00